MNELLTYFERHGVTYHFEHLEGLSLTERIERTPHDLQNFNSLWDYGIPRSLSTKKHVLLIAHDKDNYHIFDSHPRSKKGMQMESLSGKAMLERFKTLGNLNRHLKAFFISAHVDDNGIYEITPVCLPVCSVSSGLESDQSHSKTVETMQYLNL